MTDSGLKEKLLSALEDVVSNYNAGLDEETSIAKAAAERDFNKAQTERLCELYNTSRTLHHFEHNTAEKAASFKLVKKDDVLNLLFDTSNEKMASEFRKPGTASEEYGRPETDFYGCKSAVDITLEQSFVPAENDTMNINTNTQRMSKQLSKLRKEADHLNADAGIETEKARQALRKLAGILTTNYSVGDIEKVAAVIGVLANNEKYASVFEDLASALPSYVMSCNIKLAHVVDDRIVSQEVSLIKKAAACSELAELYKKQAAKKLAICKKASDDFNAIVIPHQRGGRTSNEMDKFLTGDFQFRKQASPGFLAGIAGDAVRGYATAKGISTIEKGLSPTPEIEKSVIDANKRLINIHREMLLTDLINNDPYLSEEDPQTIVNYYNAFADLSPDLANNKEVARSVLRQAVHNGGGGFSPFDAGSFLDAEKTLKETRGTLPVKEKYVMPSGGDAPGVVMSLSASGGKKGKK